jgi:protein O-GlcNAc transferase
MSRNDVKTALAAAQRVYQSGQLHQAKSAFEKVLQIDKKEPDSLHCLGLILFQLGEQQEGICLVTQSTKVRPKHVETLYNLGIMLQRTGDLTAAADSFHKALAINPKYMQAHFAIGNVLKDLKQLAEAAKSFRQATLLATDWAEAHFNLGNVLRDLGQHEEALQSYRKAVVLKPDWAEAHSNVGHSLINLKSYEEGILSCKKAIALDPNLSEPHFNMGAALSALKKPIEALISYRIAVILKPDWAEAQQFLGHWLAHFGRYEEAVTAYRKLIALEPDWAEAYNTLGLVLVQQGFASMDPTKFHEAEASHRQALALQLDLPDTYCNLASSPLQTGLDMDKAIDFCQKALELKPDFFHAHQLLLFLQQYSEELTPELARNSLEKFSQTCFPESPKSPYLNLPDTARRLRIGYLSPDFFYHACSWFIEPLLSAHNQQQVEVFCYANVQKSDKVTERLKALTKNWYDLRGLGVDAMLDLIRSHSIDILVDLAGHTTNNLLPVFHHKPAPIQASWLGYPTSTGLAEIDYRISDPLLTPHDTIEYYAETVWNLDRPSHCYLPHPQAPAVGPLPAEQRGHITFGSFNNMRKVNLQTVALWAQALHAVSGSHLLLKSQQLTEPQIYSQYIEAFRAEGIAEDRIELLSPISGLEAHLNIYNRIDIALDSFPYNGATTTMEALWMGVPVITLVGWRTASRYGLSFLDALDLRELAAEDMTQFASIAMALASDLPKLAQLRADLRERMRHSSLCDAANFAHALETAYRQMWKLWCQKQVLTQGQEQA